MSDTLGGALIGVGGVIIGSIGSFFAQALYYHWIEKGKLQKERYFEFKKEKYFLLQQKFEIISERIVEIDKYLFDKNIPLKNFNDIVIRVSLVESLIVIYFPSLSSLYQKYLNSLSSYCEQSSNDQLKSLVGTEREELIQEIKKLLIQYEIKIT